MYKWQRRVDGVQPVQIAGDFSRVHILRSPEQCGSFTKFSDCRNMTTSVSVIGHRGATGLFPEQSLAGFSKALELGVDGLEMDLAVTADRQVIAYHDETLNPDITRNSDGEWIASTNKKISEYTLEQLKSFDIGRIKPGSEYARRFPNQSTADGSQIPTLEEVVHLDKREDSNLEYFIEVKYYAVAPFSNIPIETCIEAIVSEIDRLGISARAKVNSFDWKLVQAFRQLAPQLKFAFLTSESDSFNTLVDPAESKENLPERGWTDGMRIANYRGSVPRMITAVGGTDWHSDYGSLSAERISEAHTMGIRVYAWTANHPDDWSRLVAAGIDGIITDYPDRLIEFLGR